VVYTELDCSGLFFLEVWLKPIKDTSFLCISHPSKWEVLAIRSVRNPHWTLPGGSIMDGDPAMESAIWNTFVDTGAKTVPFDADPYSCLYESNNTLYSIKVYEARVMRLSKGRSPCVRDHTGVEWDWRKVAGLIQRSNKYSAFHAKVFNHFGVLK
jgi:hypothetical protein